jgi:LysR family cyn operon transcriptional activator
MELRHLRYFLSIVKLGSFTRASEELCVTQPTLSHQIRQLEEELGCELLERSTRQVRLTDAGEIFAAYASRATKEVENGKLAIQQFRGLRQGSVTFGVVASLISSLMPVLSRFQIEYPGIHLNVLELPTGELERQVRDGELAFGVAYGPGSAEQVEWEDLLQEELALIVTPHHELARQPAVSFAEIAQIPIALLTRGYVSRKLIDAAFAEAMCTPHVSIEMNSIDAMLQMVASTGLATVLTTRVVGNSGGRLVAVPIRPALMRSAGIFTRHDANRSPGSQVILDMIRDFYRPR